MRNGDFVKITVLGSKPDPCQDCGGWMETKEHFYVDVLSVTVFGVVTGTSLSTLHWYPVQIMHVCVCVCVCVCVRVCARARV